MDKIKKIFDDFPEMRVKNVIGFLNKNSILYGLQIIITFHWTKK